MIRLEGLTKTYGKFTAVNNIDLHVPRGELFGFLGPNGAGKTTTLRMIAGIMRPTAGRIWLGGDDLLTDPMSAKTRLGFIPDRPFVYDKLTGAEFLRFVAGLYGQDGDIVAKRIDELLEVFELSRWKHELVESYSHGMRQKLIISSALIHRPECIVVDEPMVGLDPKAARLLKDIFRQFVNPGRYDTHEHAHARSSGGDVRPDRHHPEGRCHCPGHDGRLAATNRQWKRQPRGVVPETHWRRGGSGTRGVLGD